MNDLPGAEEFNNIAYVWVVAQTQDIVVGDAGLLLWCNHKSATLLRKMALNRIGDAVNLALKAFQCLLQGFPVYVQIAGGQLSQGQHLLQGVLNFT